MFTNLCYFTWCQEVWCNICPKDAWKMPGRCQGGIAVPRTVHKAFPKAQLLRISYGLERNLHVLWIPNTIGEETNAHCAGKELLGAQEPSLLLARSSMNSDVVSEQGDTSKHKLKQSKFNHLASKKHPLNLSMKLSERSGAGNALLVYRFWEFRISSCCLYCA